MRICNHCGHENHEGSILCEKCGHVMEEFAQTIVHTRQVHPSSFSENRENPGVARLRENQSVCFHVQSAQEAIVLPPTKHTLVLGRANANTSTGPDIDLSPYQAYKLGVSRQHAHIIHFQESVLITDLGSANGTYVNGQRLQPHERYVLHDGDEVCLGQLVARVYFT